MSSTTVNLRVLVGHAGGALFEFLGVLHGPPVAQIALGVELAAFVVEAVGQFVADGGAGVAVVGRVVHFRIEERRLQDAGGEIDVVHLRVVVGVDGGRGHLPLGAVDGLADLRQLAAVFKRGGAFDVAE